MSNTINPFETRARIRKNSLVMTGELPSGTRGSIIGALTKACGSDVLRRLVLGWLFDYNDEPPLNEKSTYDLTEGQWCALNYWIDYSALYEPSEQFFTDAAIITKAALAAVQVDVEEYLSIPEEDKLTRTAIALGGQIKESKESK